MELYASLARERPHQILGIFIRDANNFDIVPPLEDPTGENAQRMSPVLQRRGTHSSSSSINSPPNNFAPLPDSRMLNTPHAPHRLPRSMSGSDTLTPRQSYTVRQSKRTKSDFPQHDPTRSPEYFTSTPLIDLPVTEEPQPITPPNFTSYPPPSYPPRRRQDDDAASISSRISLGRTSTSSSVRQQMSDAERKQYDLQQRVYRARMEIPERIPLRVFREPSECIEAGQILDSLNLTHRQV